ncbi:hypothetical protein KBD08_02645 [Candidatus Babeliales bacterium]|nr:hypothetical protein [Candidatus Babeliales bacterium]
MFIIDIVSNTPIYVWFLFAYLLIIGLKATKTRTIWVPQLFTIPIILTFIRFHKLWLLGPIYTLIPWIIGIHFGVTAGVTNKTMEFIIEKNSVRLKGSYATLIILLTLFSIKYIINVMHDLYPLWYEQYGFLDTVVTFLFAGYSFGKAIIYTSRFLKHKYKKSRL